MKNTKLSPKALGMAVLDSGACVLTFDLFSDFFFSVLAQRYDGTRGFLMAVGVLWLVCVLMCPASLTVCLKRLPGRKEKICHFFLAMGVGLLWGGLSMLNYFTVNIRLFPVGDFHDSHGLLYVLMLGWEMIFAVVLRVLVLIVACTGKLKKTKKERKL